MIIEPRSSQRVDLPVSSPASERSEPAPIPKPAPRKTPAQPVGDSLDRLFLYRRGELNWDQMTSFRGGARRQGHQLILWSFMAVLIDCLILLSMSCFFLISFALIVKSPFGEVFRVLMRMDPVTLFGGIFLLSSWLYLISLRIFFGFSIGEWACDLRLGQPTERARGSYPWKVLLRSSLIVGTGLVLLPLLSLLSGRDLAGRLSGIRLISLK